MVRDQALVASGLLTEHNGRASGDAAATRGVWNSVYNDSKWVDANGATVTGARSTLI